MALVSSIGVSRSVTHISIVTRQKSDATVIALLWKEGLDDHDCLPLGPYLRTLGTLPTFAFYVILFQCWTDAANITARLQFVLLFCILLFGRHIPDQSAIAVCCLSFLRHTCLQPNQLCWSWVLGKHLHLNAFVSSLLSWLLATNTLCPWQGNSHAVGRPWLRG